MNTRAPDGGSSESLDQVVSRARVEDFSAAAARLKPHVIDTPLLPFEPGGQRTIRLKAENLQPLGSFKIRAAFNALLAAADTKPLSRVATASAGNFAQGLMLAARHLGAHLTVHLPDTAASIKRESLQAMGASVVVHSFADWWHILMTRDTGDRDELFVHPVCEPAVVIGNGTIGLELLQQWPQVDTVVIPIGGGGLAAGIALAIRASGRRVRIIGCEIDTATPLTAAFAAGKPMQVERRPSFVDGIGSNCVLDEMWPLLRRLIDDVIVVSTPQARAALSTLVDSNHLVVEGAAAVALAAAKSARCAGDNVAVILSGGNIDRSVLCEILGKR